MRAVLTALNAHQGDRGGHVVLRDACSLRIEAEEFESILSTATADHLDVIRGGVAHPVGEHSVELCALTREGVSLRVRRVHLLHAATRQLAFLAHELFGEEINVNAYWSPAHDKGGLALHRDPYDIVVFQVAGAKAWELTGDEEPQPVTLRKGDAMFLPAMVPHRAHNPFDEPSVHLSVGIHARTTMSVVEWLASEVADTLARAGEARRSLTHTEDALDQAIDRVCSATERVLRGNASERFRAYRRAAEYERMLMTPEQHARSDARRFR
jgi:ribosomal protein L16 Arg81 hydroxylase